MSDPQILISAGEASGDMHAAQLVNALRARAGCGFFGLGGEKMQSAGVELLAEAHDVAVVGISEAVKRLPSVWRVFRRMTEEARRRRPALAVLVDFPDFHLRLARRLAGMGVRIVYFISPQLWAWRPWRVNLMKRAVERVICIFPFEVEFYERAGVAADYVGHPLAETAAASCSRGEFFARHQLSPGKPMVALLPGSRRSELEHHLELMLDAAQRIQASCDAQFVLPLAPGISAREVSRRLRRIQGVKQVQGETYDALAAADAAIVASGTATVEAALLGAPMVVVYRLSAATAFLARRMVRVPFFAMPNLIAGRRIVTELFQEEFTAERAAAEVLRLLASQEEQEKMRRDLAEVRDRLCLGGGRAIQRAADIVATMLKA
jgi:lipid-A-disaccharide synthase